MFNLFNHKNWVDRIIKPNPIINWTTMNSAEEYMEIIRAASDKLVGGQTLVEWELDNFARG